MFFQATLINWYHQHKRDLPWRKTTDAYVIWLSEIILQQTRVAQGLPYFNKFLAHYPTVKNFAAANEEQVLKLWQGLGYYSRARNMLYAAKQVMADYGGIFPTDYNDLLKLKGVGKYTAAAIASLSVGQQKAVIDGNVYRVLARYFGILEAINTTKGHKMFEDLAAKLIENQPAAVYNQAIMEFGALQCKPQNPLCDTCPLHTGCYALQQKMENTLPIKLKLKKVKERHFNYFVLQNEQQIWIKKRVEKDIWQQMYDFPMIETKEKQTPPDKHFLETIRANYGKNVVISPLYACKHLLTHQIIFVQFFALEGYIANFNLCEDIREISIAEFKQLPHPKIISDFMDADINITNN